MKITKRQLYSLIMEEIDAGLTSGEGEAESIPIYGPKFNVGDYVRVIHPTMDEKITGFIVSGRQEKMGMYEPAEAGDRYVYNITRYPLAADRIIFDVPESEIEAGDASELVTLEGKKAASGKGKPYGKRRRGKTESQAQQMSAGIALRAREEGTKKSAIKKLKGAPKEMAKMSLKDLRKLATIRRGSEVPDSTKKGHERAALPGHVKPPKKKK